MSAPAVVTRPALTLEDDIFRVMADELPHIIWVHGPDGRQVFVNNTFCSFFGTTRAEMRDGRWRMLVHPDDEPGYASAFERSVREHTDFHAATRVRVADGRWRTMESWGRARFGPDGDFLGHVGTSIDITERLAEEERQKLLARELAHRVKNAYAVASALVGHALRSSGGSAEALRDVQGSLRALAAASDLLMSPDRGPVSLRELIVSSVGFVGLERFDLDGHQEVEAPRERAALALVLSLHELCTNALKYGALSSPDGRVALRWRPDADRRVTLQWTERGGPPVTGPVAEGFGFRLIRATLERDLGAAVMLEVLGGGLSCTVSWPPAG